jgi:hypothetical protein
MEEALDMVRRPSPTDTVTLKGEAVPFGVTISDTDATLANIRTKCADALNMSGSAKRRRAFRLEQEDQSGRGIEVGRCIDPNEERFENPATKSEPLRP